MSNEQQPEVTVNLTGNGQKASKTFTDMRELNEFMDKLNNQHMEYQTQLAEDLKVSDNCASKIVYLRTRSRWTQEKEDELIRKDQAGEDLPMVFNGDF